MISIECPNCGRRGEIPPDRLSSRLHCMSCNAVIYLDRTGQLAVDESAGETNGEAAEDLSTTPPVARTFRLVDTWREIPTKLKVAVPIILVLGFLVSRMITQVLPDTSNSVHARVARAVLRAVVANDRERVMALADPPTAEDAGRWFDLVRERFESTELGQDVYVNTTTIVGNVDKDTQIVLMGTLSSRLSDAQPPMATELHIHRMKGDWTFDGTETLKAAESGRVTDDQTAAAAALIAAPNPNPNPGPTPMPTPPAAGKAP